MGVSLANLGFSCSLFKSMSEFSSHPRKLAAQFKFIPAKASKLVTNGLTDFHLGEVFFI